MGFSSLDDIIVKTTTDGQIQTVFWQKATSNGGNSAAGRWHELLSATGVPSAVTFSGSAGVATALNSSTAGAMQLNGNVSPDTRHALAASAWTGVTTIGPGVLILCDFLLYYPSCVVTGTPTVPDNTVTLPRYTDGIGVMAVATVHTAFGAASPNLTFTYTATDSAGSTTSQTGTVVSPANSAPISTVLAANGGPYVPIAGGKVGIKKIDSYTINSGGTTGTMKMLLVKPLATIPIPASYVQAEREFLYQIPSLPEIEDGACLGWLLMCGGTMAANSNVMGTLTYMWGG